VKVVGTLSIALVAIVQIGSAGMSPVRAESSSPAGKARPIYDAPDLTPPDEVEGAWISDPLPSVAPQMTNPVPLSINAQMPQQRPMMDPYAERAAYLYGGYPQEYEGQASEMFGGGTNPYAEYGGECGGDCGGECECGQPGCTGCCGTDGPCGVLWNQVHSHQRFYAREEYLRWQGKGNPIPALVTTSPDGTAQADAGVLGVPGTEVLFGDRRYNNDWRNGGRLTLGMWLVDGEFLGIEGHYMALEQSDQNYFASGTFSGGGSGPILARPFFNVSTGLQDSSLIAFPNASLPIDPFGVVTGDIDGSVRVQSKTDVQSAGLLLRKLLWIEFTQNWRLEGLAGYRFFRLADGVAISDDWTLTSLQFQTFNVSSYDYFQAKNQFHGGELGLVGTIYRGRWSVELLGKIALGNMHENVRISGTSFINTLGTTTETENFRLLTQPTNDGSYHRNVFAVLPETNLNLRFDLCCNCRLIAGYNFMYLSQAQRSGKAIDLNVDPPPQGPSATQPSFKFRNDDYWLHGVNAGVEFRW
jgi:hypothetical protein